MYSLPHFKDNDSKRVKLFIQQHPFALITGCNQKLQPVATQIPMFVEERGGKLFLSGHMMKNTDHHKAFQQNPNVLAVFTGAHSYVSATWYDDPHQASTWNYMSVHVRGTIRFLPEEALVDVLRKTTLHFENGNHASTTVYDNLPKDYVSKLVTAIVAFEVEVETIENVTKLSQNKNEKSYDNIIRHLEKTDDNGKKIASEMKKRKAELFS